MYPQKNLKVRYKEGVFTSGYIKSRSERANFSIEKIQSLGWEPYVDIMTGFRRMLESYQI